MARIRIIELDKKDKSKKLQKLNDLNIEKQLRKYKTLTYILLVAISIQYYILR